MSDSGRSVGPSAVNRARVLATQLNQDLPARPALKSGDAWRNWAGTSGECHPEAHHYPQSVSEVVAIVKSAVDSRKRTVLRVAGSGLSPNAATFTPHQLIHMDKMRRILNLDAEGLSVTCEAGIKLSELVADLQQRQLTIPVIPSILDMTLGGAIAMAAHGTGINTRSFSGYVLAVTVVDGSGNVHTIDASTPIPHEVRALLPPSPKRPHRLLDAFACHLGALGVVTAIKLRVERLGVVHVVQRPATLSSMTHAAVDQRIAMNDYYRFHWVPHTEGCYELIGRRMKAADDEAASSIAATEKSGAALPANAVEKRARDVGSAVHLLSSPATLLADQRRAFAEATSKLGLPATWLKGDVTEAALAMAVRIPSLLPRINRAYQTAYMSVTKETFGSPADVLTMDCLFKQHAMEFAVDISKWKELFDEVQHIIGQHGLFVHFPVEVRFTDEESAWLSPSHGRKSCFIGIVMFRPKGLDPARWQEYYSLFEQSATRMGGRPHWAKTFSWRRPQFEAAYPNMPAFLALQRLMDPKSLFVNEWFRLVSTGPN